MVAELRRIRTQDGRELVLELTSHAPSDGPDSPDGPDGPDDRSGGAPDLPPAVLFEAGMGASRHSWGAVVALSAASTDCVTYDRSGLGDSPATGRARDLGALAADLVEVMDALDGRAVILVGHSWGGPIVRRAAEQRPAQVAGLVLVDVTEETCDLFFGQRAEQQTRFALSCLPVMARLGLLRLAASRLARSLPEPAASGMRSVDGTTSAARTQQAELRGHIADLQSLLDSPPALPDVPTVYISGGRATFSERSRRPALVEAHRHAAAQLPSGRHVVAAASSHYVPLTEPSLVSGEIDRILDAR